MWKNGQNETEHSTWMQLLTGMTVHRRLSELSVVPSGQKIKQNYVAGAGCHIMKRRSISGVNAFASVYLLKGNTLHTAGYVANLEHRSFH